ncbi:cell wall integrity and stress response component 4-like [Fundulus heteroclitus]|uniref:cell wall integrity and stress response component 4-like n=1 Tax=Fundulus heteroclitus TaxID=8078 RepID=UPI00165A2B85|nr:cell wall integrity and stress response component 4-like [Fundulus heteroclitus]
MENVGSITSGPTCCSTSLCNDPRAVTTASTVLTTTTRAQTTTAAPTTTTGALRCLTCTDRACSSTVSVTCGSETMCITTSILASSSGETDQQIYKGCALSSVCPSSGSQTFSVNLGFQRAIASAECCNTDDCNSQTPSLPGPQYLSGLQCVVCDPTPSQCQSPTAYSGDGGNCVSPTAE